MRTSPVGAHTPRLTPVVSDPSTMRCVHSWWVCTLPGRCSHSPDGQVDGWRGEWSCCCRGIPQSAPEGLFLFEKILLLNPGAPSLQVRACPLTQSTSPARLGTAWVRAPHGPTPNSPQLVPTVSVYHTSSLFPSLQLQATRSLKMLPKPCLAGEGAVNRLSPRTPAAGPA